MPAASLALRVALAALFLLWAFFGLVGRSAWAPEEAVSLGWVLDLRAGLAAPAPAFTGLADLSARLASPWLGVEDGARLSSALWTLLALAFTALAARELFGAAFAVPAALALMGAFGLMLRAHALLPEVALLAAHAGLLYALALTRRRPLSGGVGLGLALLAMALLRGLVDLFAGLVIVAGVAALPAWRLAARSLLALAAILLGGLATGFLLHPEQATLLSQRLAPAQTPLAVLKLMLWSAWPLWPLALWALWHEQRRVLRHHALHPALISLAVLFSLALWPAHSREGAALPALAPLALLAAYGLANLRRGAAQAFYWFGVVTFAFFALAFWVYFAALEWGWPAALSAHLYRLTPNYPTGAVTGAAIGVALAATFAWFASVPFFPRASVRPLLIWATGMALSWILLISLFKPWAEAGWGYRPLLFGIERALPANACLAAEVDPAMQAMLRLHFGPRLGGEGCAYVVRLEDAQARQADPEAWAASLETKFAPPDAVIDEAALDAGAALPQTKPGQTSEGAVAAADAPLWSGFRPRNKSRVYTLYLRGAK